MPNRTDTAAAGSATPDRDPTDIIAATLVGHFGCTGRTARTIAETIREDLAAANVLVLDIYVTIDTVIGAR